MKIWKVNFEGLYPVGNTLIIAAESSDDAWEIAKKTIAHTAPNTIEEIDISKPCVIEYLSGDY